MRMCEYVHTCVYVCSDQKSTSWWDIHVSVFLIGDQPWVVLPVGCDCHVSVCCLTSDQPWAVLLVGCDCHIPVCCHQCNTQTAISHERSYQWNAIVLYQCVAISVFPKWRSALVGLANGCDWHVPVCCHQWNALMAISLWRCCRWNVIVLYQCVAISVLPKWRPALSGLASAMWLSCISVFINWQSVLSGLADGMWSFQ